MSKYTGDGKVDKISFFIDSLTTGGAERVVLALAHELLMRGYHVDIVMMFKKAIVYSVPEGVDLYYAEDLPVTSNWGKCIKIFFNVWNKVRGRIYIPILRKLGITNYSKWNETRFYFYSYFALPYREYLKKNEGCCAFGFLIRSNIALLQAAKGMDVRTVFCERNNPVRPDIPANIVKIRDRIYPRCNAAVFQTEEERSYYTKLKCDTAVIPNPIKANLPKRFTGQRRYEIVNFCRLNKQKNLFLLIDAFEMLLKDYPNYILRIYGNGEDREKLSRYIIGKKMEHLVFLEDFISDIHNVIRDVTMFVSTSDYEGLSNSMLEAMAIGLPCVCTDCAGGGARMMIQDHVNGILVPVGDVQAVYKGMKEIIEHPELAEKLSKEASRVREQLSINKIADQWEKIFD